MSGSTAGNDSETQDIPRAAVRRRRVSVLWVIPVLALAVVGYLIYQQAAAIRGATITITFEDAQGIEPGSELVHRGIRVGLVRDVRLSGDLEHALVVAELDPSAEALAAQGTSFWVVRPELSLREISGLDTLVGPNYIALRPGESGAPAASSFEGLESPPALDPDQRAALRVTLETDRLGTLSPGAPVLYREVRVGSVRSAKLAADATRVLVEVQIDPRYTPLVRADTRFWRSGGVGVDFGLFTGLSVEADSLESVLSSSISLATPETKRPEPPAPDQVFELADEPKDSWLGWAPEIDLAQ